MKRWHQFNRADGHPIFGLGTIDQAREYIRQRNAHLVANRYALTTLDDGEKPEDGVLVVDLDTFEILPERYRRPAASD